MGILVQGKELWSALFGRTRRRILTLLFGFPEQTFYANELVRIADVGTGSVQRELARLETAGIIQSTRRGNQKHYQANRQCPFYTEIRAMVIKTYGIRAELSRAIAKLEGDISLALVFGEAASQLGAPGSGLELLVVSADLSRQEIEAGLAETSRQIDRTVKLTLLRPAQWSELTESRDAKIREITGSPHIILAGALN